VCGHLQFLFYTAKNRYAVVIQAFGKGCNSFSTQTLVKGPLPDLARRGGRDADSRLCDRCPPSSPSWPTNVTARLSTLQTHTVH
jgi:hypothetical protein